MTNSPAVVAVDHAVPARGLAQAIALRLLVPVSTMLVIGAVSLLLLFTPVFLHPALDAADSAGWLGMDKQTVYAYSDRTVGEVVLGPGTFDFRAPDGSAFFDPAERGHMRDVRVVFYGFLAVSAVATVFLVALGFRRRFDRSFLRGLGRGGGWLAVGTVVIGAIAAFAFDAVFETFHELLFPGGNFTFDPKTERLVQLYPIAFWELTAAALAVLLIGGGAATWWLARRRFGTRA